ncbi:hypothetical protein Tco_0585490 [Tanacetum coccineum]
MLLKSSCLVMTRNHLLKKFIGCLSYSLCITKYPDEEEWRGKWGPLVAKSGEGGGSEEEVRWCDGGGRD